MTDEAPTAAEVEALIARLRDLIRQATAERSHYYVAAVAKQAAAALAAQAQRIAELEHGSGVLSHKWLDPICDTDGCQSLVLLQRADKAEAALRQAPPREPTEAMIDIGCEVVDNSPPGEIIAINVWLAMYDAAPAAAPGKGT